MTKHTKWLDISNTPHELAGELGDLYYNSLSKFITFLADKIECDAYNDKKRGRVQLAYHLKKAAKHLYKAADEIKSAWKICKPYMKDVK